MAHGVGFEGSLGGSDPLSGLCFLQSHSPGDSRRCEQCLKPASCPTTGPECTWGNRGQGAAGTQGPLTVDAGAGPTSFSGDTSAPSYRQRNGLKKRAGALSFSQSADPWLKAAVPIKSLDSDPWSSSSGSSLGRVLTLGVLI